MGADGVSEREQARSMHRCEQLGVSRQRRRQLRLRMCDIHHPEGAQETPTEDMGADGVSEREQARRMHRCEQRGVSRQGRQRLRLRMYDIQR